MKRLILPLIALAAVACNSGTEDSSGTTTTGGTAAGTTTGGATTAANGAGFTAVADIATKNCMPCHSADKHAGGLALTSYDAVMKGGEHGPSVKAGDPDNSLLVKVLKGAVDDPKVPMMPMKHAPLSAADIATISNWIKDGAKNA